MVVELRIRKIGNSLGIVFPKKALASLKAVEGDTIILTGATDGTLRLAIKSPGFGRKMKVVDGLSRRYCNALRELAE
jgi:putative addiction module antidote